MEWHSRMGYGGIEGEEGREEGRRTEEVHETKWTDQRRRENRFNLRVRVFS